VTGSLLVVDDDPSIRELLNRALSGAGYAVRLASTGQEGLDEVARERPQLMVLDLGLPDMFGLKVCSAVKENPATASVPVLVLTGELGEGLSATTLDTGADDFLQKPCDIKELLARVRALLRRAAVPEGASPAIRQGDVVIDLDRRIFACGETSVGNFTPKEFDILCLLVRRSPEIISRPTLAAEVWGEDQSVLQSRTIDVHLRRIRRKLGEALSHRMITVPGQGYRFV
jgi:DNA-binding response OmpR family regulator